MYMNNLNETLATSLPLVLGGAVVIVLLVYVVLTFVLWYHWREYAVARELVSRVTRIYAVLSVVFIGTALIASGAYILSLS